MNLFSKLEYNYNHVPSWITCMSQYFADISIKWSQIPKAEVMQFQPWFDHAQIVIKEVNKILSYLSQCLTRYLALLHTQKMLFVQHAGHTDEVKSSLVSATSGMGFPHGSASKESVCNARDPDSISGWGQSPGGGKGYTYQYSCLENPMDRGTWRAVVHRVTKS